MKGAATKVHRSPVVAATAAVVALVATALVVVPALATPPSPEVTTTPIGMGRFAAIDTKVTTDIDPGAPTKFWRARIMTNRSSDLYVLENTIPPGKTFGWHRHPGASLVIVKSGTASFYLAADPTCTPHVVPAGSGFVVVSLVPAGFARRIDEPSPGTCLPNG